MFSKIKKKGKAHLIIVFFILKKLNNIKNIYNLINGMYYSTSEEVAGTNRINGDKIYVWDISKDISN